MPVQRSAARIDGEAVEFNSVWRLRRRAVEVEWEKENFALRAGREKLHLQEEESGGRRRGGEEEEKRGEEERVGGEERRGEEE
jgi:hypothetical protein